MHIILQQSSLDTNNLLMEYCSLKGSGGKALGSTDLTAKGQTQSAVGIGFSFRDQTGPGANSASCKISTEDKDG